MFDVPQLAVGEKATCLITLEVTRSEQLAPTDTKSLVIPKEIPKEVRKFLGPSPLIESGNSKVKAQAKTLTTDKEGAWETVEAIYDGTRSLVQFDVDHRDKMKGAIGALRDGKADKEDLNATFVALCRASRIPARMAWSMDSCYAEFYLADSTGKGMWFPCQLHGDRVFGGIKDFRAILEKGDNFKVPEKAEAQRFVAEFLAGKGGGGRPQVEFRRRRLD
jgi:transglutaminase-like putative cysteine protease